MAWTGVVLIPWDNYLLNGSILHVNTSISNTIVNVENGQVLRVEVEYMLIGATGWISHVFHLSNKIEQR